MSRLIPVIALSALWLAGCEDATKKSPNAIFGKKTQNIGEFDPNAKQKVSDSKVRADTPGLSALQAYGPMVEKISKTYVESALNVFYATEGRYPMDYDEFMERIIKENNIELPVLPYGNKYQYDVANHKLEVIEVEAPAAAPAGK